MNAVGFESFQNCFAHGLIFPLQDKVIGKLLLGNEVENLLLSHGPLAEEVEGVEGLLVVVEVSLGDVDVEGAESKVVLLHLDRDKWSLACSANERRFYTGSPFLAAR